MNAPAKRHLQRLERILRTLDEREARMQQMQGDRIAGSIRSTEWRDAEALRAVLAYFDVAATTRGVMGAPAPERCPRGEVSKPEPTCTNRAQCWEPCGLLGKSAEHARPVDPKRAALPHESGSRTQVEQRQEGGE